MLIHACFACGSPHWLWHTLHDSEHQAKVGSHSCTESAGDSGLSPDNACMCVSRLRPPRHHPSDRECGRPPPPQLNSVCACSPSAALSGIFSACVWPIRWHSVLPNLTCDTSSMLPRGCVRLDGAGQGVSGHAYCRAHSRALMIQHLQQPLAGTLSSRI